MAARSPALHQTNATIWVRVAPKMIFVEKVFDKNLSRVLSTYSTVLVVIKHCPTSARHIPAASDNT
jgi:hypothetical protein